MLFEGIFIPIATPFHPDGRLFPRKLAANVERYSRTPAAGLFVLGDASEAAGLTDDEARAVLTTAIGAAADSKVMVACIGRESVHATLQFAEFAAASGYDAIALRAPSLAAEPERRLFFEAVADAAILPVILFEEPARPLSHALVERLSRHPGIVGAVTGLHIAALKAATADAAHEVTVTTVFAAATRRMLTASAVASAGNLGGVAVLEARPALKTRQKRVGFQILAAGAEAMLSAWQTGASGAVPSIAACVPQACCEVWQAFKDGDPALAEEKQRRLVGIAQSTAGSIAKLKYACDFNGYFGGIPRLPQLPPTAAQQSEIETRLATMRN